jgi:hypothetical protein
MAAVPAVTVTVAAATATVRNRIVKIASAGAPDITVEADGRRRLGIINNCLGLKCEIAASGDG